ncbi:MAG: TonB-dependent receptor [Pseudomonadales bacterium]|nr:TonB-dependent receptor [Pseudomonadales bacterium]
MFARIYPAARAANLLRLVRLTLAFATCLSVMTVQAESDHQERSDRHPGSTRPVEEVVVTATRELKPLDELAASVGVLNEEELRLISPSHPAEALNRIAGVHINNLGGEGHMAAIRQPITTAGVYLFLEDGLPARPSGFFNHNGLYEINIPQSSRLEVTKGPASALYGSDAIGGVINVITKSAPIGQAFEINLESGSDGWRRGLLSVGGGNARRAGRLDVNVTKSDGFREAADYERNAYSGRLDAEIGERLTMKLIGAYSTIDQSGASGLEHVDYVQRPERNEFHDDIGYRRVDALRLSAEFNFELSDTQLLSATPFFRDNQMTMMPSWMVTYDPNLREYDFRSYGTLLKYRHRLFDDAVEVIAGVDLDITPSTYMEEAITVGQVDGIYNDYQRTGLLNYHFEADQRSVSYYLQAELSLNDRWLVSAGVRHDRFTVDYKNQILQERFDFAHRRPSSTRVDYGSTSPKFGVVYRYGENHHAYANYRYAFRAPTVGSLFRPGSSRNTTDLEPVTSTSAELGFRGAFGKRVHYELALYDMNTEDDIVSIINDAARETVNAGKTRHRGIELGLEVALTAELQLGASLTFTDQSYRDFSYVFFSRSCFCNEQINFAGNDVSRAPQSLGNFRLAYSPKWLPRFRAELEWESLGEYFTDQTNTQLYAGHDLYNLRLSYTVRSSLTVYLRGANLSDERFSTYTSNQVNDADVSYRPGMPRSWFFGFRWAF